VTTVFRAAWILPIDQPPIAGGWIAVAGGRIVGLGGGRPPATPDDLGDVAVVPGLVNAHTHLELGWLAGRVRPAASMVLWIRALLAERARGPAPGEAEAALARCVEDLRATGTALVGDVTNTLVTPAVLAAHGVSGAIFHELLGFNAPDPVDLVRQAWERTDRAMSGAAQTPGNPPLSSSVSAHAPYSVSPALFLAIAAARRATPLAVHLGESAEEVEFLQTGRGPFRQLLEDLRAWSAAWQPPQCDPVEYLRRVGYLGPGCLVVHGVHLAADALARLRVAGAVVVTCPRSNAWVGAGVPPISGFYQAGLRVAVGTDSLASVDSLNLFDELAEVRRVAPDVAPARLLESATKTGAEALGFGGEFGTLAPGKRAALVAVEVPAGVSDVEEYLVSGVPRDRVRLVGETPSPRAR
jgi:cytosine/adenosine deaminase-related metal-dependent hydrolase